MPVDHHHHHHLLQSADPPPPTIATTPLRSQSRQSPFMEELTPSQTHYPAPSIIPLTAAAATTAAATATTTTTTTTTASSMIPYQDPSLPSAHPPTAAAAAKIPVRPRKARKLSSDADATHQSHFSNHTILRLLPRPLTAAGELAAALRHLRAADPALAPVIDAHEPPSFQIDHPPFLALARSILYQQLAFKAAASIYARFVSLCGGEPAVSPAAVLALSPDDLRRIGVSARKAGYLHDLARKYQTGILSDANIVAMDDKSLFSMLTMVNGIGAWSVHMFMIFTLHRPDVLPVGDLGVRKGVQLLYGLEDIPRPSQMEQLCELWKPYRSLGAWYMWRLVEAKGTSNTASGGVGAAPQPQAPQPPPLINDSIVMIPNMR